MDAIVVGAGTARKDDPLLTARPPGPRTATRIVVDSQARLPLTSQLVRTVSASAAPGRSLDRRACGKRPSAQRTRRRSAAISGLRQRQELTSTASWPNLAAANSRTSCAKAAAASSARSLTADYVDEVHVFVAPKIVGGADAPSAVAGKGLRQMGSLFSLDPIAVERIEHDVLHPWTSTVALTQTAFEDGHPKSGTP